MTEAWQRERYMTVAAVSEDASKARVRFLESARIYLLPRSTHGYADSLRTLLRVVGTAQSVRVVLIAPQGEVIESVHDIM